MPSPKTALRVLLTLLFVCAAQVAASAQAGIYSGSRTFTVSTPGSPSCTESFTASFTTVIDAAGQRSTSVSYNPTNNASCFTANPFNRHAISITGAPGEFNNPDGSFGGVGFPYSECYEQQTVNGIELQCFDGVAWTNYSTVTPAPTIDAFAAASPICNGSTSTLSWSSSHGSSATITDLATNVVTAGLPVNGSLPVSPDSSRSYRLTVTNAVGSVTADVSVTVNPLSAINGFAPSPGSIFQGQTTRLNFSSSNSTTQTITDLATNQVWDVTGLPFLDVAPSTTRSFRYTAAGGCGATSQDVEVTVAPTGGSISADPNPVTVCDGTGLGVTTISWTATVPSVIVKVGAPNGTVFVSGGSSGSAATGKWVSDGMVFYLQNASFGDHDSPANTLATVTVGVSAAACPAILSFSSNVGSVCPGGAAVLSYSTQNVSSGNVNGTPLPSLPDGTMTVFPTAPFTDYVITVNGGPGGADTRTHTLRVNVNPAASADSLSATANPISAGQSTRLNFSSSNSTSQTITDLTTNQVFNVTGQSFLDVTPPSTRTYRYTASGACGSDFRDIQITVNACQAGNMTANATTITQGQTVTFTTTTANASSATVTDLTTGQSISVNLPNGTATFTPAAGTHTFRFTVNGACAAVTQDIQITVLACQTGNMTANATTINQGNNVIFTTTASNATSASVTDLQTGQVINVNVPNGTATFTPTSTRTFRYTVNGACGTFTQDIQIIVNPTPVIVSFSSSAPSVCAGGSVVLSYNTQNVTSGNINGTPLPTLPSGTMTVFPTAPGSNYTITVNGAGGQTASQLVSVSVTPNTSINSFTPSAGTITVGQSVTFTTGASNANSGTVTDLTSGQVINVNVPNGTATFTPAAAGTRTFRFTAAGTCNSPTQDVQITVNPAVTGNVLIGPVGFPGAVGPTSNNDDYTNLTISGAAAVPTNGRNSAAQTLTFINTVRNNATAADNITLSLQFVPNAAFTNAYQISVNGGASYQVFNSTTPATITVPAQSNFEVRLRVTVPANQFILAGYPTIIRATSGITPSAWNETIDRAWTGFLSVNKSQTVTNSTGVGGATAPVRGAVIRYSAVYTNITAASGNGNADLTASNLILTEDGAAAPNNWASTTNHVAGSATVTTAGATVTGDVAGSSVLTATIPTLAPGATGTFSFSRTIK